MNIIGRRMLLQAAALRSALCRTARTLAVAACFAVATAAGAQAQGSTATNVPRSAGFVGLGGSYNSVNFADQNIFAQGDSAIFLNGTLVAVGSAGGPADPLVDARSTLAPAAQAGYFQHFANSSWLWGARFAYSNLAATSTSQNVVIPQVGSFTSSTPDTFTGNVVAHSYQTSIKQQMGFVPFVGQSFANGFLYFGAGPTLSQTQTDLNGVIGFAAINGSHVNITGTPSNFSSSPWVYGGTAVVGATYFLASTWFVDFSYAYGMTQEKKTRFAAPFTSSTDGYDDIGILSGNYSGRVITQSLTLTVNKTF